MSSTDSITWMATLSLLTLLARSAAVGKLDSLHLALAGPFDPGEQRVGPVALVRDPLREIMLQVLEDDGGITHGLGEKDDRRLPGGVRLVGQSIALLPQDDELVVDQGVAPDR